MPFDLAAVKGFFQNKWALAGLAVAAGAGGYVLYRRKKSTGSSLSGTGDQPAAAGGGAIGYPGTLNTTSTDVATWLGSYSGNLQNQLDAFAQQQSDFLAKLGAGSGGTGSPPPPAAKGPHPYLTEKGDTWATVAQKLFGDASLAGALKGYNRTNVTYAGPNRNNANAGGSTFSYHTVLAVPWNKADLANYHYVP